MKKIFLVLFMCLSILGYSQISITKTASTTTARIGEVFEYTVNISGITSLSQLGKVEDLLSPDLEYLSSDFNTTSTVFSFYNLFCPTSIAGLTQPTAGVTGTLVFQFPTGCTGSGSGDLSFKIKVGVKPSACSASISTISNQVTLIDQSNTVRTTSTVSTISVDKTNPWTLEKTFRSMTGGFLIYDVRLSSSVAKYYTNVLPTGAFTDEFTTSTCLPVNASLSEVYYVPDESAMGIHTNNVSATATSMGLQFNWNIPTLPTSPSPSSYLFQVKIKVGTCSCSTTTPFDLLNKVDFVGTDICGTSFPLTDKFDMLGALCNDDGTCTLPEKPELCVKKQAKLNGNELNLTMAGCKGNYIITITNCTKKYEYRNINLTDILPSTSLLIYAPTIATVSPSTYTTDLSVSGGTLTLNSTTPLPPGRVITITIPFTVATPLPNQVITNCATISADLVNPSVPSVIIPKTKNFCAIPIKTVPNELTIVSNKKICNPPTHSCGDKTIKNNLPNDIVEYALHVYNYGTGLGTNFSITDQLPTNFNILNLATDVRVYKLPNYGNSIADICDIAALTSEPGFSDITSTITKSIAAGNKLVINFGTANQLDIFTCSGITHYIVKVKVKIAATAPNGDYTNVFRADYLNVSTSINGTTISNPVTSTVNKDQLMFMKKINTKLSPDCVNKTDTAEYEIWAINMGTVPIVINVNDVLNVPAPLSLKTGIHNLEYQITPTPGTWSPLVSSGITTVSITPTTLNINYFNLPPCSLVKFRYKVIFNTNNLNIGQVTNACNKAKVTAGYLVDKKIIDYSDLTPIGVYKDPELINKFFEATTDLQKSRIVNEMKAQAPKLNLKTPILVTELVGIPKKFIAIATAADTVCLPITDCLKGATTGCFSSANSNPATFKINSIGSTGLANTTLTIPSTSPKVRKVEYVLSDIRMLTTACPPMVHCFNCSNSIVGYFTYPSGTPLGPLTSIPITNPVFATYLEKNKVEFSNPNYLNISGSHIKNFQLPVSSLNCNGNLEVVITAIIYYEDCSVCYVSDAKDCNAKYTWIIKDSYYSVIDKK